MVNTNRKKSRFKFLVSMVPTVIRETVSPMRWATKHAIFQLAVCVLFFSIGMNSVDAAEVTMSANVLPPVDLGSITPTGTGTSADPYLYTFTTANGLEMVTFKLYGNSLNNKHTRLDLNGGDLTGNQTSTAFDFKAPSTGLYAGNVTIENVNNVQIGSIITYAGKYNPGASNNAGAVTIGSPATRAALVEIFGISTYGGGEFVRIHSGAVTIDSSSNVFIWDGTNVGGIIARNTGRLGFGSSAVGGDITIRHDGEFRAGNVHSYSLSQRGGDVVFNGDILANGISGPFTASIIDAHCAGGDSGGRAGTVNVSNYTDITATNGIQTYQSHGYPFGTRHGGSVQVTGSGFIKIDAGGIGSYVNSGSSSALSGSVTLQAGTNVTIVGSIVSYGTKTNGGLIQITAGGAVSIEGVDSRVVNNSSSGNGGNLIITAVDDIDISGSINLEQVLFANQSRDGYVDLSTIGGAITLASLDMGKILYAKISGSEDGRITGTVANFDTGGSQTTLRTPSGKKIYYDQTDAGNAYLGGLIYSLANLAGTTNVGGTLVPYTNVWTNGNLTNNWNDDGNWSLGHVPVSDEVPLFTDAGNGGSNTLCNAAADTVAQNLYGIIVASGYTSTITFASNYGDAGTLGTFGEVSTGTQDLAVTGLVELSGGAGFKFALTGLVSTQTFVPGDVTAGTDQLTVTAHGYSTGHVIQISTDTTMPGGLTSNKGYYARAVDANTITLHPTLSTAQAGTNPMDLIDGGAGIHTSTRGIGVSVSAANITVGANALVHSDSLGFPNGQGPRGSGSLPGAHGGRDERDRSSSYGSSTEPITLGSAGLDYPGGGAIKFAAGDAITVDGTIRVNGGGFGIGHHYGGAGGSIWLTGDTLNGSGLMQANGGPGNGAGGGGGGGRIAVTFTTMNFLGDYDVSGGIGGPGVGQPGTVSIPSGVNLTVNSPYIVGLPAGSHNLGVVTVTSGAELFLHNDWNPDGDVGTDDPLGFALTATSFTVDANGLVDGDFDGYAPGRGPGAGEANTTGGAHGGRGGNNWDLAYGSTTAPVTLGSGGQDRWGGGAIKIDVGAGIVTVNGTIRSNGMDTVNNWVDVGAGGSVYLLCGTFTGSGLVQARGGNAVNVGAGGGGRIAVSAGTYTYAGDFDCRGGSVTSGAGTGLPGTLSLPSGTDVTVNAPYKIGLAPGSWTLGNVTVASGAELFFHGDSSTGVGCALTVTNLIINVGGVVSGDIDGYKPKAGPGAGAGAQAGAHGGRGGNNNDVAYGSATAPVTLGSGGDEGWGGGAVKIDAGGGTITIDGTVRANGQTRNGTWDASGAGGSVYILAATLTGSGTVEAKGGDATGSNSRVGGGGRIALSYTTSTFTGSTNVSAGAPGLYPGEAGSVTPANLDVSEHVIAQATDAIADSAGNQAALELYKFNFQTDGNTDDAAFDTIRVTQLVFDLTAVTGILNADIANVQIFADTNNNGDSTDDGAALASSSVNVNITGASGTLTVNYLPGSFEVDGTTGNVNFIFRTDINNIVAGDTLIIQLNMVDSKISAAGAILASPVNLFNATNTVGFAELAGATTSVRHQYPITNIWTNGNTNNNWNDAGNWSLGHVPLTTELVKFTDAGGGGSNSNCNAASDTVAQNLNGITLESGYTSTITFDADFADAGVLGTFGEGATGSQALIVNGDITLQAGTMVFSGKRSNQNFATTDVDTTNDIITLTAHGYATGDVINFSTTTTIPAGLAVGFGYYVRVLGANTFTLHVTQSDAQSNSNIVDMTSQGAGTHTSWRGVGVEIGAWNVAVASGAVIHADGKGFLGDAGNPTSGPGYATGATSGGGTHGGRGDGNDSIPYGDPTAPVTLGSGGRFTAGGGALKLNCPSGSVTLNGTVRANGESGIRCGSGGSVWIVCNTFAGAGTGLLQSNGGNSGANNGGGGGRIAVSWASSTYAGSYECSGGTGDEGYPGVGAHAGTLSLPEGAGLNLTVDRTIGLAPGNHVFGTVSVTSGATLRLHGDVNTGIGCSLTVSDFNVDNGSTVSVAMGGYRPNALGGPSGPGFDAAGSGEGAHGGRATGASDLVYGSPTMPITFGSAGNFGWGGGAMKIDAGGAGTITINGLVQADAQHRSRNGAGGSIWFTCATFTGTTGEIRANGGGKGGISVSGGGGGRISVAAATYTYAGTYECIAGFGDGGAGVSGTLNLPDGVNLIASKGIGFAPGTSTFGSLTVTGTGSVVAHGDWDPNGNGGTDDPLGCTIVATGIDIQSGGSIRATGQGYLGREGDAPGDPFRGASHGGRGGNGGLGAYGSATTPVTMGSGGGDVARWGGGALFISVAGGTVNIDGTILCDGIHSTFYGGPTGGTISVTCNSLTGSGALQAIGGNNTRVVGNRGGGGGGRIALRYAASTFTGSTSVVGGNGNNAAWDGEVGSVTPANLDVADHVLGQATNALLTLSPTMSDAELFKFNFQTDGNTDDAAFEDMQVTQLVFDLTSVAGIVNADITNVEIFVDLDNDGDSTDEIGPITSSGMTVSIAGATGTITLDFAPTNFIVDGTAGKVNYILQADLNNLVGSDALTVQLNVSDTKITVAGTSLASPAKTFNATNTVGFAELFGATTSVAHFDLPPTLDTRTVRDTNGNGQIDQIELTFSESIDDSTVEAGDFSLSGGYTILAVSSGTVDDNTIFLDLNESGTPDTDAVPTVTFTQSGGTDLADLGGVPLANTAALSSDDAAAPVLLSASSAVGSTTLTVTFSEPVDTNSSGTGDLITGDFAYVDASGSGAASVASMNDANGTDDVVTLTMDVPFELEDFTITPDTLAAVATQIFDVSVNNNPVATTVVTITASLSNWTGLGVGDDWSTAGNWDAGVPGPTDNAVVTAGIGNPEVTGLQTARSLTIGVGKTVIMAVNGTLTLYGTGNILVGTGSLDTTTNTPNTVDFVGQGAFNIPASTPISTYHHLSVSSAVFSRIGSLAFTGDPDGIVIDSANGFAYVGTAFPAEIYKVRLSDFSIVGAPIDVSAHGSEVKHGVIDAAAGFAYFPNKGPGGGMPARILKIDLSNFTLAGFLPLAAAADGVPHAATIDVAGGFAYFGTEASPARISKVRLSDFTLADTLTLPAGDNHARIGLLDATAGFIYFALHTTPGKVAKIRLSDFTHAGTLTTSQAGENQLDCGIIDPVAGFAYFGNKDTSTNPGIITKVNLGTFSQVLPSLTLPAGRGRVGTAIINPATGMAYFGTRNTTGGQPGYVVEVSLSDFSVTSSVQMAAGETELQTHAAIDLTTNLGYFLTDSANSVVKVGMGSTVTLGTAASQTLTVNGDFTIGDGVNVANVTGATHSPALDVNGSMNIQTGSLFAAPVSASITVAGNWTNNGSYTHGGGTVILDGGNQMVLGTTTFNNLTKVVSNADTLTFEKQKTQTIVGTMNFQGAVGQLLSLRSSEDDADGNTLDQWQIDPQGTRTANYLDVKDSENINVLIITPTNSLNSGLNINWNFSVAINDSYSTTENEVLTVAAPGVLNNDIGFGPITASVETVPSQGTLKLSTDGSFVYIPNAGFSGTDSFTYTASGSNPATVSIMVNVPGSGGTPPKDGGAGGGGGNPPQVNSSPILISPPVAAPNEVYAGEQIAFTTSWSDPDGDSLQYKWAWGDGLDTGFTAESTQTYTFVTPGSYTVVLSVTDGLATVTQSLIVNILAFDLLVQKAKAKTNLDPLKTRKDKVFAKGQIVFPTGFIPTALEENGLEAAINFGGIASNTINLMYKGKPGRVIVLKDPNRQFKLRWRLQKRARKPNAAKFIIKMKGTGFAKILKDNGYMVDATNPMVTFPITLRLGTQIYQANLNIIFGTTKIKETTSRYGFLWKLPR